jgi:hypothetical protein
MHMDRRSPATPSRLPPTAVGGRSTLVGLGLRRRKDCLANRNNDDVATAVVTGFRVISIINSIKKEVTV